MVTKQEVLSFVEGLGVSAVGVTSAERLADLPTGPVLDAVRLQGVREVLPSAESVVLLAYRVWDPVFNVVARGPLWLREGVPLEEGGSEFYQLSSQVLDAKAWALASFLRGEGCDAVVSRRVALKPAAVVAGLGCRGKNTLVLSPVHGPFVRFSAVLTSAVLEPDEPYVGDLCGDCTRCMDACPTGALKPHELEIRRCLTYAAENPFSVEVEDDVRGLETRLIRRPTLNSFIECTICQDVCPAGRRAQGQADG